MKFIPYIAALLAGMAHAEIPLTITATDPDGDNLTISAEGLPPGLSATQDGNTLTIDGSPTTEGDYAVTVRATDGRATVSDSFTWSITAAPDPQPNQAPVLGDIADQSDVVVGTPPPPPPAPVAGTFPPMSTQRTERYKLMKAQYETFYSQCNFAGDKECWRYDPMKTLYELAERARLVGDTDFAVVVQAKAAELAAGFIDRWPITGGLGVWPKRAPDSKVNGHASAHLYSGTPMTAESAEALARMCFNQGWRNTRLDAVITDPDSLYSERHTGLGIQCLVDLHKLGFTDVLPFLRDAVAAQHAMITGAQSGRVIGAPMHSIDGHECSNTCKPPGDSYWDAWMFSPWMGSSFLMPALWEYYHFVEHDPKVPEVATAFARALLEHGIVDTREPHPYQRSIRDRDENPTPYVTLYAAVPDNEAAAVRFVGKEGDASDQHNPEAMFALALGWYFGCDAEVKALYDSMAAYFTQGRGTKPFRRFLWQHRGSASTEWLIENAQCQQ